MLISYYDSFHCSITNLLVTIRDAQQEETSLTTLRQLLQVQLQTFSSPSFSFLVQDIHRFGKWLVSCLHLSIVSLCVNITVHLCVYLFACLCIILSFCPCHSLSVHPSLLSIKVLLWYVDGCESGTFLGFEWKESDLGDYASSECPCSEYLDTLAGRAFRYCGGDYRNGARWSQEIDTSACVALTSNITSRLCQAAAVSYV